MIMCCLATLAGRLLDPFSRENWFLKCVGVYGGGGDSKTREPSNC